MNPEPTKIIKKKASIGRKTRIILDSREDYLIKEFTSRWGEPIIDINPQSVKNKVNWEKRTLPVGDIWFQYGENILILIERKTISDLNSSITQDGRYREQKARIMDSKIPQKYYLLEGNFFNSSDSKKNFVKESDLNRLYSAIIHTTIRDRIPFIRTENFMDTMRTLEKIYDALEKHGPLIYKNSLLIDWSNKGQIESKPYIETLKPSKKENMTPKICYQSQLMQIPGVSAIIAQRINEEYGNLKVLLGTYEKLNEDKKPKMLQDLVLPTGRRIGPAVSKRVYEFLFHES